MKSKFSGVSLSFCVMLLCFPASANAGNPFLEKAPVKAGVESQVDTSVMQRQLDSLKKEVRNLKKEVANLYSQKLRLKEDQHADAEKQKGPEFFIVNGIHVLKKKENEASHYVVVPGVVVETSLPKGHETTKVRRESK